MSTIKLEVGKFYIVAREAWQYVEVVYKDPEEERYPYLVIRRVISNHECIGTYWHSIDGMGIFSNPITEEIPNPRMTSTTPTTDGTNWLSPLTDFYGKMEEVQELLEDGLISEEKAMSIMKQCQRQLEAKDKAPPDGRPEGSTWFPPIVKREDAPFDTDGEDEEDGCGSDEEYLDNLLEEEKKRFADQLPHPAGSVGIGRRIVEELLIIRNMCEHEWVDTGFHKSWCRKCDVDRPEGDNVTNDTQVTTNGRLS